MAAGLLSEVAGIRLTITVFAGAAAVASRAYLWLTRNIHSSIEVEAMEPVVAE